MAEPERFDLSEALGYLVVRVAAALEHSFTEVVAAEGLTVRQFGILALLSSDTTMTAADIARRIDVTPQSVGPQIDTLVSRGFVQRGPHPGRGRPVAVQMTASGRQVFARAARLAREEQQRTTGHLSNTEREQLANQLSGIASRANRPR